METVADFDLIAGHSRGKTSVFPVVQDILFSVDFRLDLDEGDCGKVALGVQPLDRVVLVALNLVLFIQVDVLLLEFPDHQERVSDILVSRAPVPIDDRVNDLTDIVHEEHHIFLD